MMPALKRKLTILTDLDDVLWDLLGVWISELNLRNGTHVMPRDIIDWEIAKFFPGLTHEELFEPLHDERIWNRILPIKDAMTYIDQLMSDGHKLRVVTATHFATAPAKFSRFLEMFPIFKWEDIVITSDKSLIHGDVMIDDGTHNLEAAAPNIATRLLFNRPHNREYDAEAHGMIRVSTWKEIYQKICDISK